MQIILTQQSDGKWYGRIPDSDDGYGNEIDCLFNTPEESLKSLKEQYGEGI